MAKVTRRTLLRWPLPFASLVIASASTQATAAHTYRIVVPFPAGGITDFSARMLSGTVRFTPPGPVVVQNVPGGSGLIGTKRVASSVPDGTELLISGTNLNAFRKSPESDSGLELFRLRAVASLFADSLVLLVAEHLGVSSLGGLHALVNTRGGELRIGITIGLASEVLAKRLSATLNGAVRPIPYTGGGDDLRDLLGGHIDGVFVACSTYRSSTFGAAAVPILVTSLKRVATCPNTPSAGDLGHTQLILRNWYGVFAPAATPDSVVASRNASINAALTSPAVVDGLSRRGLVPLPVGIDSIQGYADREIASWAGGPVGS